MAAVRKGGTDMPKVAIYNTDGDQVGEIEPVSYTHLDVYKRQFAGCGYQ